MTIRIDRRDLLAMLGGAGAVAMMGVGRAFATEQPITVGILYSGSKQDYGYNQAHATAAANLRKLPGVKIVEEERVPETIAVQRSIEGMINQDGASLIIATSFGYFDPHVLKMAEKYPDVGFAHCGGLWKEGMPANVGTFYAYIFSAQYLSGMLAGHMTKTKKLGIVASKPTPNLLRSINAYTIAARSVDPSIAVQVIFTGEWTNPVREAESTTSLIDQGADVISCHVDSPKVVIETAEKRGVMSCGYHSSQADLAPKGYLTGAEWNWVVPYTGLVERTRARQPLEHYLRGGLAANFVKIGPIGSVVTPAARQALEEAQAKLVSGELNIYSGPLKDNNGTLVIPAGTVYKENDRALDPMKYLVEGVTGQV